MNKQQFLHWANLVSDALLLLDHHGCVQVMNHPAVELLRDCEVHPGERLLGLTNNSPEDVLHFLDHCSRTAEYFPGALSFRRKGDPFPCRADGVRVDGDEGAVFVLLRLRTQESDPHLFQQADGRLRIEALSAEIARRKSVEEKLTASELRMRAMLESLDDVVFEIDKDYTYVNIWTTREDLLPRPKAEMIGHKLGEFMGKAFITPFLPAFDRVLATGIAENVEYGVDGNDGLRWFLGRINPLRSSDGTCRSVCFVVRDISERKRAEESIRELSGKLLRIQDEERRRIARELHDDLAQILSGISMQLAIPTSDAKLDPRTAAILEETASLAQQANERVRNISHLLHPPLLDEVGLLPAVEWYIDRFARLTGIQIELQASVAGERIPHEIESALFRVLQESLTNVYRHSGSLKAAVRITRDNGEMILEVEDYGRGFPPHLVQEFLAGSTLHLGVGLRGMRERLNQLGGSLEIVSALGKTIIRVRQSLHTKSSDRVPRFLPSSAGQVSF